MGQRVSLERIMNSNECNALKLYWITRIEPQLRKYTFEYDEDNSFCNKVSNILNISMNESKGVIQVYCYYITYLAWVTSSAGNWLENSELQAVIPFEILVIWNMHYSLPLRYYQFCRIMKIAFSDLNSTLPALDEFIIPNRQPQEVWRSYEISKLNTVFNITKENCLKISKIEDRSSFDKLFEFNTSYLKNISFSEYDFLLYPRKTVFKTIVRNNTCRLISLTKNLIIYMSEFLKPCDIFELSHAHTRFKNALNIPDAMIKILSGLKIILKINEIEENKNGYTNLVEHVKSMASKEQIIICSKYLLKTKMIVNLGPTNYKFYSRLLPLLSLVQTITYIYTVPDMDIVTYQNQLQIILKSLTMVIYNGRSNNQMWEFLYEQDIKVNFEEVHVDIQCNACHRYLSKYNTLRTVFVVDIDSQLLGDSFIHMVIANKLAVYKIEYSKYRLFLKAVGFIQNLNIELYTSEGIPMKGLDSIACNKLTVIKSKELNHISSWKITEALDSELSIIKGIRNLKELGVFKLNSASRVITEFVNVNKNLQILSIELSYSHLLYMIDLPNLHTLKLLFKRKDLNTNTLCKLTNKCVNLKCLKLLEIDNTGLRFYVKGIIEINISNSHDDYLSFENIISASILVKIINRNKVDNIHIFTNGGFILSYLTEYLVINGQLELLNKITEIEGFDFLTRLPHIKRLKYLKAPLTGLQHAFTNLEYIDCLEIEEDNIEGLMIHVKTIIVRDTLHVYTFIKRMLLHIDSFLHLEYLIFLNSKYPVDLTDDMKEKINAVQMLPKLNYLCMYVKGINDIVALSNI